MISSVGCRFLCFFIIVSVSVNVSLGIVFGIIAQHKNLVPMHGKSSIECRKIHRSTALTFNVSTFSDEILCDVQLRHLYFALPRTTCQHGELLQLRWTSKRLFCQPVEGKIFPFMVKSDQQGYGVFNICRVLPSIEWRSLCFISLAVVSQGCLLFGIVQHKSLFPMHSKLSIRCSPATSVHN